MLKALVVAVLLATTAAFVQPTGSPIVSLNDLTVPSDRLPAGCALVPSASDGTGDGRVRGSWTGLPISTNPWIGSDRDVIVAIRLRTEGAPNEPDGPPLSGGEAARFRQHLADGVDEAYAAFYRPADASTEIIAVYGSRLADGAEPPRDDLRRRAPSGLTRVTIGAISAVVHGARSPCAEAIGAHLTTLAAK